jgi:hypothetical protein
MAQKPAKFPGVVPQRCLSIPSIGRQVPELSAKLLMVERSGVCLRHPILPLNLRRPALIDPDAPPSGDGFIVNASLNCEESRRDEKAPSNSGISAAVDTADAQQSPE